MTKRWKILSGMLLSVLLLGLILAGYGAYRWQAFKQQQGITAIDLGGLRLSWGGVHAERISLTQQRTAGGRLTLALDDVQLRLAAWWKPLPLQSLTINRANVQWLPATGLAEANGEPWAMFDREQLENWAAWIPRRGHIAAADLVLPCATGTCEETAEVRWRHAEHQALPFEMTLKLQRGIHHLTLGADLYQQGTESHLDLQLLLDGLPRLSMQNQLTASENGTRWHGTLAMNELPEAPWLLDWLGEWLAYAPPTLAQLPQQMRIGAGWALHLGPGRRLPGDLQAMAGEFRLSANLPVPWPVVGFGQLQGRLDLAAKANQGAWIPTELAADMTLQPAASAIAALPPQLRPTHIRLVARPLSPTGSATELQLTAQGPSPATLNARLSLDTRAPYSVKIDQARFKVQSPALTLSSLSLSGLMAELQLSGHFAQHTASIRLEEGSRIAADSFNHGADIAAAKLQLGLAGIAIKAGLADGQLQSLQAEGPATANLGQLQQPLLRPQSWRWQGQLNANLERLALDGTLGNAAGLPLALMLTHNRNSGATRLEANLAEIFLRAGNPLAGTFANWPRHLELNTGRLQAQGQLDLPSTGPLVATATVNARGLAGIYDRTELDGLDAKLLLALQDNQLRIDVPELTLRQANPGFAFGPMSFSGGYAGSLEQLGQGRLAWQIAETRLLGGRLWLDPGAIDLAARTQQLTAHLRGLQLPLLFQAYPTEGLGGTGVIDGELQLQRSEAGVSIEQGSLEAREPGGILQFRSAKIQALGRSNPAMRLVAEALDDFHYDLLTSDVRYATDGTLELGLKLHGRNPALEGGRPINLSINLEEDIPALLTSLQLSGRVSEAIQRRVQESLE